MSAAAPELRTLGVVDGVTFAIGRTSEPWTLPIDMLMISAGQSGALGALGEAVWAAMPTLAWDRVDFRALTPKAPQVLAVGDLDRVNKTSLRLRSLAVATVRGAGPGSEPPATVAAAADATASVIRMANANSVAALGLPLLGSDVAGLPADEVAEVVVPRVVDTVTGSGPTTVRLIVFVCRDVLTESAIRGAWELRAATGERAPSRAASTVQRYADVLSDVESAEDRLGITADVNAVAALLAAATTPPPLSVALMGNWGSGKSTFMNLVHQRVAAVSEYAAGDPESRFSPVIRQVRFNAWHYSDDHVWVGLVEHLFRALREQEQLAASSGSDVSALEADLKAAQNRKARLDDELNQIDELDPDRGWWGWLWQPRRLALIMRAARRQASRGLTVRSVLARGLWVVAAGAVTAGFVLGSPLIAWLAALPAVVALVTPAVAVWRRAREIADAAHTKLVEDKKEADAKIEELHRRLAEADPVRGLRALVDELTSGDRYKPFRGLTGQIHQDLARLDGQMSMVPDPRRRQRIILYVDDLDRCTSDRVVHVLQAVNLLLTMPLFVVVVAVDPRWLLKALQEHYGTPLDGRVRALDYLDKIFHVPFAVRPMNERAGDYLRSLLPDVEPVEPVELAEPGAPEEGPRPAPQPADSTEPEGAATDEQGSRTGDGLTGAQLRIRPVEADFLPRIAALLDTPRAVKKAVNLYVLLRATIPDAELDDFLGDERGGPFQAAALLIAGIVSCPAEASELLECVMQAKPDEPITPALRNGAPVCARLAERIEGLAKEFPLLSEASEYQPWARTVARYSFESYALFGDESTGAEHDGGDEGRQGGVPAPSTELPPRA